MKKLFVILFMSILSCVPNQQESSHEKDLSRWQEQAKNVEIIRDDFGVPHIYGKT